MSDGPPITVTRHGSAAVVAPSGDVDLTASPTLKNEFKKVQGNGSGVDRVVVDLSGVPYMDSSGLATLVEAMQVARRGNQKLVLCGLSPRVKAIFEIAKLQMVFTIVPTVEEALVK